MKRYGFRAGLCVPAVWLLCVVLLTACGQKGDLYLPADGGTEQQQTK